MNNKYEREKKSNFFALILVCGFVAFWLGFCWSFGEYTLALALGV